MQIQNISNQPKFKGNVILVGEFSAVPTKLIRKSASKLAKIIDKKPYDLFLEQNHARGIVTVSAQREKDYMNNKGLKSVVMMKDNEDFYEHCANYVVKEQDLKLKYNQTTGEKIKNFYR